VYVAIIPVFMKTTGTSVRISGTSAGIRTRYLLNIMLERHCCTNLLSFTKAELWVSKVMSVT
jgi:hypothetical protein